MERDIPCRDTPRTFLFIHFNSTYFNFIPNNSISFQIYFSFQKNFSFMLLRFKGIFQDLLLLFILFGVFFWFVFFSLKTCFSPFNFLFFIVYYYYFFIAFVLLFFKSYFQLFFFKKIKFSFFRNSFSFFSMFFFLNVFEFALECLDWLFFSGGVVVLLDFLYMFLLSFLSFFQNL